MFEIVMGIDDFLIQLVKYCTCESANPANTVVRSGRPRRNVVAALAIDFRIIRTIAAITITRRFSRKYPIFRSIPTDTKKKLMNMSRKGMIFPIACWLY